MLHGSLGYFFKSRRGALSAVGGPGDDQPSDGFHIEKANRTISPSQLNFTAIRALKADTAGFIAWLVIRTPVHRSASVPPRTISNATTVAGVVIPQRTHKMVVMIVVMLVMMMVVSTGGQHCKRRQGDGSACRYSN